MEELKNDILDLIEPTTNKTIREAKALSFFDIDTENDIVKMELLVEEKNKAVENLRKEIVKLVKIKYKHRGIKIDISERKVHDSIFNSNVKVIGIISGKGGVGKSSIAANIAYRFTKKGYQTALIDADIYGSSIPELLNIPHQQVYGNDEQKIIPINYEGLEIMSTDFFTENHEPVIWRGAMLNNMLNYFFFQTAWNKATRVVIIDFPPGTGDIMLDINSYLDKPSMLLITTPHKASAGVAVKAGIASQKMNQNILGIVENMSYYLDKETKKKHYIFGKDGGKNISQTLGVEMIAEIPIEVPKNNNCLYDLTQTAGQAIDDIVDYLIYQLDIKK